MSLSGLAHTEILIQVTAMIIAMLGSRKSEATMDLVRLLHGRIATIMTDMVQDRRRLGIDMASD